jgi:hypothetical protein
LKIYKRDNECGITLIGLVITIIVLLILAGVSINSIIGENGILTKAQDAVSQTDIAEVTEKVQMDLVELQMNSNSRGIDEESFVSVLSKYGEVGFDSDGEPVTLTTEKGNVIDVKDLYSGNFSADGPKLDDSGLLAKKYTLTLDDATEITIPKDYGLVDPLTEALVTEKEQYLNILTSENVENGIVIQDKEGNQFVWIPVSDVNKMAKLQSGSNTDYEGRLYDIVECTGFNIENGVLSSNNQYIEDTTSLCYVTIDLTNESSKSNILIEVDYSIFCDASNWGYFAVVDNVESMILSESSEIDDWTWWNEESTFTTWVSGGSVYYLFIGYVESYAESEAVDTLEISSIRVKGEELALSETNVTSIEKLVIQEKTDYGVGVRLGTRTRNC